MTLLLYITAVVGYFAVGVLWGFLRWKSYVDGELDFYEQERIRFLRFHRIRPSLKGGDDIPEFLIYEWRNYVKNNDRLKHVPPKVNDFTGEIAFDVLLWWLSMAWQAVSTGFTIVMKHILSEYNRITNTKINRVKKDLEGKSNG